MVNSMKTTHKIILGDSKDMKSINDNSVDLMITSPPYPMIEMWDDIFSNQNEKIKDALSNKNGYLAFELMHQELDKVWKEVYRVLRFGGIACINIGDATRTIDNSFKLYTNHTRILSFCTQIGFDVLPEIIWRKQSNKPNKFMGSGMLPVGAYTTLEHEYILILRKGTKKSFDSYESKLVRHQSAFFWEERNNWFSDIWEDLKGHKQNLNHDNIRERSAAYPFDLAYRLINMFSVQDDTVLDPFLGTGTSIMAAMASGRNSIGIEIDKNFETIIQTRLNDSIEFLKEHNLKRISKHSEFVEKRLEEKKNLLYINKFYNFPVMTRQEINLKIPKVRSLNLINNNIFEVEYE